MDDDPTLVELRACIETALTANPLASLLAARRARKLLVWVEAHAVDRARAEGWSWGRIAQYLGIAKQTLHRRHGHRTDVPVQPPEREAITLEERVRARDARLKTLLEASPTAPTGDGSAASDPPARPARSDAPPASPGSR